MLRLSAAAIATTLFFAQAADAACPTTAPSARNVTALPGDQKLNAAWLQKTLTGMKLRLSSAKGRHEGTEDYRGNGAYRWVDRNGMKFDAPAYRFYDNGIRCIGYAVPRFDYYVVNDGRIVLINSAGERYTGQLTR